MNSNNWIDDDQYILDKIYNRDEKAFDVFYEKYWSFVYNCAYKRLQNVEAAKDITQEVFSQFWVRIISGNFTVISNVKGYLYIAVRNLVFKWIDSEQKLVSLEEVTNMLEVLNEGTDVQLLYDELLTSYLEFIESLPEKQQMIFKLKFDEGYSSKEIANLLGVNEKTVRNQLGRALSKMKTKFVILLILISF